MPGKNQFAYWKFYLENKFLVTLESSIILSALIVFIKNKYQSSQESKIKD